VSIDSLREAKVSAFEEIPAFRCLGEKPGEEDGENYDQCLSME
jgi:hypothetical protein